jgi:pimeloyl-ACP methyl ester carboxylesterase
LNLKQPKQKPRLAKPIALDGHCLFEIRNSPTRRDRMPTRRDVTLGATLALAGQASALAQTAKTADLQQPWTDQGDVKVAGGKIHWVSVGKGDPIVLMPKLGGWVADWRHIAPLLAAKYRVIAIDNPGHGGSVMNGPPPYWLSLPESAAMLMATLDELGIEACALGGNSLGGCIATIAASLWPKKFSKLILLSVALGGSRTRAELEKGDAQTAKSYDDQDRPLPRPFAETAERFGIKDPVINDEQNASRAVAGPWVRASERGVGHAGIIDYLPQIVAPTLLMYGALGGYKQFEAVGLANIPKVKSVHIPNASSFAHQDQPAATAQFIMDFLGG